MQRYRFITEDDTSAFCERVSQALSEGWRLYGEPKYVFDAGKGMMRCAQAVVRDADLPEKPKG